MGAIIKSIAGVGILVLLLALLHAFPYRTNIFKHEPETVEQRVIWKGW
ncbi:MAG TPA: hypothetical protein VEU47_11200 [Candidatus Cybelea sp.]|nr:hypothetical protein [Candidatus Cybelea sp.]